MEYFKVYCEVIYPMLQVALNTRSESIVHVCTQFNVTRLYVEIILNNVMWYIIPLCYTNLAVPSVLSRTLLRCALGFLKL